MKSAYALQLKIVCVALGTVGAAIAVLTSRAKAAEEVEGEIKIQDFSLEVV